MRDRIVIGRLAIGAPQALEFHGRRVPHRDALVAIAIGQYQLIGLRNDANLGHALHVVRVQAALAAVGMTDLAQEFSVRTELQDEAVMIGTALAAAFAERRRRGLRRTRLELFRAARR